VEVTVNLPLTLGRYLVRHGLDVFPWSVRYLLLLVVAKCLYSWDTSSFSTRLRIQAVQALGFVLVEAAGSGQLGVGNDPLWMERLGLHAVVLGVLSMVVAESVRLLVSGWFSGSSVCSSFFPSSVSVFMRGVVVLLSALLSLCLHGVCGVVGLLLVVPAGPPNSALPEAMAVLLVIMPILIASAVPLVKDALLLEEYVLEYVWVAPWRSYKETFVYLAMFTPVVFADVALIGRALVGLRKKTGVLLAKPNSGVAFYGSLTVSAVVLYHGMTLLGAYYHLYTLLYLPVPLVLLLVLVADVVV